jgi:hypothetical protein
LVVIAPYHRAMPLESTRRLRASRFLAPVLVGVIAVLALGGCARRFDPSGPCSADGTASGAYPELEAAVPKTFRGAGPAQLDSGRFCSAEALATLAGHGMSELRFAGGTWSTGTDSGVSLAVFVDPAEPTLQTDWLADFYETGARSGKNVQSVNRSTYLSGGLASGVRIDVLNGESFQTVILWSQAGRVAVALIADFIREIKTREAHDAVVNEAVAAFGS